MTTPSPSTNAERSLPSLGSPGNFSAFGSAWLPRLSRQFMPALLELSVPAKMQYLKCIRGFIRPIFAQRIVEDSVDELVLAVDEACTNVVKYGQGLLRPRGRIHIVVTERRTAIEVAIKNFCKNKDVPKIKPRDLDDLKPGGLGTHIIREIMDSMEFVPDPDREGRMCLVMIKNFDRKTDNEADG